MATEEPKQMSNEMIVHMFTEVQRSISDLRVEHGKDLEEIKTQTTKTNGRVNSLENWQAFIKGGLAVLVAILLPMLFIVIRFYFK